MITKAIYKSSEEDKKEEEVKKTLEQHDNIVTHYKNMIREQVCTDKLYTLSDILITFSIVGKNFSWHFKCKRIQRVKLIIFLNNSKESALARLLSGLECHPTHQKAAGSIPGQGSYRRQPVSVSLSLSLSFHPPF